MKIKRFMAKDMRATLAQVKEELGVDAVIMSNKKVSGGIEIVAAVDYDDPKVPRNAKISSGIDVRLGSPAMDTKIEPQVDSLQALLERQQKKVAEISKGGDFEIPDWAQNLELNNPIIDSYSKNQKKIEPQPLAIDQKNIDAMRDDIASLKDILMHQVSSLLEDKQKRNDPFGTMLRTKLLESDFSPWLTDILVDFSRQCDPNDLLQALPNKLADMINSKQDVINQGGVIALVGATGVGKTTTLAKLAARFVYKYGVDQIVLITSDHYRIGAYEQLATYGRIMGCIVKKVEDVSEIENVLYQYRNRRLVLLDTPGMGQRDMRLYQQLDDLTKNKKIQISNYLVLSATASKKVLEDTVRQFKRIPISGAILTKLDESVSIAGALSVLIEAGLSLDYITDGQRVPEDLELVNPLTLANQALSSKNMNYRGEYE